jgi:hypothetical protein
MPTYSWPVISYRPDNSGYRFLVQDFELEMPEHGITAKVPNTYQEFNGASVPRPFWRLIGHPYMKEFERAALVHDYLYDNPRAREHDHWGALQRDRKGIDLLFWRMLRKDGVARARANAMYWAVRTYSGKYFSPKGRARVRIALQEDESALAKQIEKGIREVLAGEPVPELEELEHFDAHVTVRPASPEAPTDTSLLRAELHRLDLTRLHSNS